MSNQAHVVIDRTPSSVYVGRAGQGEDGYFGNPYRVGEKCARCRLIHLSAYSTLVCFVIYFDERLRNDPDFRARVLALRGRALWCPGRCVARSRKSCHAVIIADWINAQCEETIAQKIERREQMNNSNTNGGQMISQPNPEGGRTVDGGGAPLTPRFNLPPLPARKR